MGYKAGWFHHSEATKEKIRLANIGKKISAETCAKLSKSHMGIRQTEETKAKISLAHKGKPKSEKHRHNMSLARMGKPMPEANKKKMSLRLMGNKYKLGQKSSDKTRKLQSEAMLRYYKSPAGIENIRIMKLEAQERFEKQHAEEKRIEDAKYRDKNGNLIPNIVERLKEDEAKKSKPFVPDSRFKPVKQPKVRKQPLIEFNRHLTRPRSTKSSGETHPWFKADRERYAEWAAKRKKT